MKDWILGFALGLFAAQAVSLANTEPNAPIDFSGIEPPIILCGDSNTAYRDPAALYHDGTFYLFYTLVRTQEYGQIYSYTALSTSQDLQNFSTPRIITPRGQHLNFSSPGNVVRFAGVWILCLQTYPRLDYRLGQKLRWANEKARLFVMRSKDLVNWTYFGRADSGENVCVLVDGDEYVLFHSPGNGIGVKRSKDLKKWRDVNGLLTLGQKQWPWAQTRITAGVVLDLRDEPRVGKYLMFFHGGGPGEKKAQFNVDANCSLGIAWSDNLKSWSWPGKAHGSVK